jgi:hypothetical protein
MITFDLSISLCYKSSIFMDKAERKERRGWFEKAKTKPANENGEILRKPVFSILPVSQVEEVKISSSDQVCVVRYEANNKGPGKFLKGDYLPVTTIYTKDEIDRHKKRLSPTSLTNGFFRNLGNFIKGRSIYYSYRRS